MNILVLHRIPYHKIKYHLGIDHQLHDVVYAGTRKQLDTLPSNLRCLPLERPGDGSVSSEVIAAARALGRRFDRVISLSEYELLDAAHVREALNVPGPRVAEVTRVRDKLLMKDLVAARGLRVPRAMNLTDCLAAKDSAWAGRTVLKPVDGASSENVRVFPSLNALRSAISNKQSGIPVLDRDPGLKDANRFETEEFVGGPIIHLDGLVVRGRVQIVQASRYVGTCLGYAEGRPLGSVQTPTSREDKDWTQAVIEAVGIVDGSFHLEAIVEDGAAGKEKVFLEIANRVGGADVVDTFEMATGVHLPSAELKAMVGGGTSIPPTSVDGGRYGWFVFPGHHLPSGPWRLAGHETFLSDPMLVRASSLPQSSTLPRGITYQATEVPFAGVIGGASTDDLEHWLGRLFDRVTITSVAPLAA